MHNGEHHAACRCLGHDQTCAVNIGIMSQGRNERAVAARFACQHRGVVAAQVARQHGIRKKEERETPAKEKNHVSWHIHKRSNVPVRASGCKL